MPKPLRFPIHFMVFLCSVLGVVFPGTLVGQTAPIITRDPAPINLANQALQSLAGGVVLADVSIQANAVYTVGSEQATGTATLIASRNSQSVETLSFSDGTGWQLIRNGYQGATTIGGGEATAMPTHNCFIDADWFFPALSLQALATDSTLFVNYGGQQVYEGQQVYHLTLYHNISTNPLPSVEAMIQATSAMDLYLDATTLQPGRTDDRSQQLFGNDAE
jgi:hypothetical protein